MEKVGRGGRKDDTQEEEEERKRKHKKDIEREGERAQIDKLIWSAVCSSFCQRERERGLGFQWYSERQRKRDYRIERKRGRLREEREREKKWELILRPSNRLIYFIGIFSSSSSFSLFGERKGGGGNKYKWKGKVI